jgi:hypothetical protein
LRLAAGGDDVRYHSNDLIDTVTRDSTALSRSRRLIDNGTVGGTEIDFTAELVRDFWSSRCVGSDAA